MGLLGQSKTVSKDWEGTRKFHNLMWDMQNIYEDKIWQLYSEREIGFTYRSQFERSIDIFQGRNNGKKGIRAYVLGTTHHRGYHYKHEGLLYDLYVKKTFLPLYGGLHGKVGNLNVEQEQER